MNAVTDNLDTGLHDEFLSSFQEKPHAAPAAAAQPRDRGPLIITIDLIDEDPSSRVRPTILASVPRASTSWQLASVRRDL